MELENNGMVYDNSPEGKERSRFLRIEQRKKDLAQQYDIVGHKILYPKP